MCDILHRRNVEYVEILCFHVDSCHYCETPINHLSTVFVIATVSLNCHSWDINQSMLNGRIVGNSNLVFYLLNWLLSKEDTRMNVSCLFYLRIVKTRKRAIWVEYDHFMNRPIWYRIQCLYWSGRVLKRKLNQLLLIHWSRTISSWKGRFE